MPLILTTLNQFTDIREISYKRHFLKSAKLVLFPTYNNANMAAMIMYVYFLSVI